jgi:nucleoside-diphosphate-sugar epimerase
VTGLTGADVVVHSAARVHQVRETAADPAAEYMRVNCAATLQLAQAAAKAGVRRFVFLSSVKVNGDFSLPGQAFRSDDPVSTQDPYGLSKWKAEQGLAEIAARTGLEVVVVRPPLVYGAGVKANFETMMRVLYRGLPLSLPLPLGAIKNCRSLVALPNLVDFLALCCEHPQAAGQTLMVSDQQDVSTSELLRQTALALGTTARLVSVPPVLLKAGLGMIGKAPAAQRLMGDLAVDSRPATQLLGWKPVVSLQEGLKLAAQHYIQQQTPYTL